MPICFAQSTTVSGTLQDSNGIVWTNAKIQITFQYAPGIAPPYTWSGGDYNSGPINITTDGSGFFSISLPSNTAIVPSGSTWFFSIAPNASTPSVGMSLAVTGVSQDISSQFTTVAPIGKVQTLAFPRTYTNDYLAIPPNDGQMAYNSTEQAYSYWAQGSWHTLVGIDSLSDYVKMHPVSTQTITQPGNTDFSVNTSGSGKMYYNNYEVATINQIPSLTNYVKLIPTTSQVIVQPSNTTLSTNSLNNIVYADQFPGADLGLKIQAAIAASPSTRIVVKIPASSTAYQWATQVIIDPRLVSIEGDGSSNTLINCTIANCLQLNEATFSLEQGGIVSGFSMIGDGSANQIGIESHGVQQQIWDDLSFKGFTGSGAISLYFNNTNVSNGWQERMRLSRVRVQDGAGLNFNYNTSNSQASSFGYANIDVTCDDVNSGEYCLQIQHGLLYNSIIHVQGNVDTGGSLITISAGGTAYDNLYSIQAETQVGASNPICITVATAGQLSGQGLVSCGTMPVVDSNGITFTQHLRIVQPNGGPQTAAIGNMTNFLGSGNTGVANILATDDLTNPYVIFGSVDGPFISSPFVTMQNVGTNAFVIYSCPFQFAGLGSCSAVAEFDNSGGVTIPALAGSGNAVVCINSAGKLYRGTGVTCP
jgi:hypothetical protein